MAYHDDDGNEIDPKLIPLPVLCLTCKNKEQDDEIDNVMCNLNRLDQKDSKTFECGAYEVIGCE